VPEAHRPACAAELSGLIGTLAGTEDGVDYTQTPFQRRFFTDVCKKLPDGYHGSWLEREVISSELEDSYHDLAAMERIVRRLADSARNSKESIDKFEVAKLLHKIEYSFNNAGLCFVHVDEVAKQREPA
jgi:hypothetical protein